MGNKIPKTYDGWEAWGFLLSALVYLIKHPTTYGAPLVLLLGGGIFNEVSHYSGIDIQIVSKAKPIDVGEDGSFNLPPAPRGFSLMPEALAQDKSRTWKSPNAIVIDKQFFDFYDERYKLFKKEGKNEILVYHVPTKSGVWWEAEAGMFDEEKYK